jgi:hypothetical protein
MPTAYPPRIIGRAPARRRTEPWSTPACPSRTQRPTSRGSAAAERWPGSSPACGPSPTTSPTCCRSRRWWRRWGAGARSTSAVQSIELDSIVGTVGRGATSSTAPSARPRPGVPLALGAHRRRPPPRAEPCRPPTSSGWASCTSSRTATTGCLVARAMGDTHIDAHVGRCWTKIGAGPELRPSELPLKRHERVFRERVPLPAGLRDRIQLSDGWRYAPPRASSRRGGCGPATPASTLDVAPRDRRGLVPRGVRAVPRVLREANVGGEGTETERYCGSRRCGTCCSRRTSGRTRRSSGCSGRSARPPPATTRWSTASSRSCPELKHGPFAGSPSARSVSHLLDASPLAALRSRCCLNAASSRAAVGLRGGAPWGDVCVRRWPLRWWAPVS